jgi:50S ribosomal subunit-associated GTPase HflX
VGGAPELLVFNQVDRLPPAAGAALADRFGAVAVSALHGTGLADLLAAVEERLWESQELRDAERTQRRASQGR